MNLKNTTHIKDRKISILESEMWLGAFPLENFFWIEQDEIYKKNLRFSGIKLVECIVARDTQLLFIEAKSSAPNPNSLLTPERLKEFLSDIHQKFTESLDLYLNRALVNRVPYGFRDIDYNGCTFTFILIIRREEDGWIPQLQEKLLSELRHDSLWKIWNCRLFVLTEKRARKFHLIDPEMSEKEL